MSEPELNDIRKRFVNKKTQMGPLMADAIALHDIGKGKAIAFGAETVLAH